MNQLYPNIGCAARYYFAEVRVSLNGSLVLFHLFDVAEAVDLDRLASLLGADARRTYSLREQLPGYARFEPLPLTAPLEDLELAGDARFRARIRYFDYGVVSIRLDLSFIGQWQDLIALSARWTSSPDAESAARRCLLRHLEAARPALIKPYEPLLSEDYTIVRIDPFLADAGELVEKHGGEIAQIVRGEPLPLAREERQLIFSSRISYAPNDLLVPAWSAAFICDAPAAAETTIDLLEYANSQLLEFRFYDDLLTRTLSDVYRLLDHGTGFLRRWRLAREAERLNTIRLDIHELTERSDTAIKFLSDMFAARLYKLASARIGVPDYRNLVDTKLRTAADLYHFMTERVHQSSALILETMVVIILIIDLVYLFRGKT